MDATAWPALDEELAKRILQGYGIIRTVKAVQPLGGGVSSRILLAEGDGSRVVLKQPLERFLVEADWRVDPRRVFVEHAFFRALAPMLPPGSLAPVRTFLPQFGVLILDAVDPSFQPWKTRLLVGDIEPALSRQAADLLSQIHQLGAKAPLAGRFRNADLLLQQRIDPYFRTVAHQVPDLAPRMADLERDLKLHDDLIHGDFSPKNLLTDGRRLTLVDHEVAARGDAAFDVAFLLSHLALKGIHRPQDAAEYAEASQVFLDRYLARRSVDERFLTRTFSYVGGLLAARAVGKSPVEYLSAEQKMTAVKAGKALLLGASSEPDARGFPWDSLSMN